VAQSGIQHPRERLAGLDGSKLLGIPNEDNACPKRCCQ